MEYDTLMVTRTTWRKVVAWILLMPVAYGLSIGPAAKWDPGNRRVRAALFWFYKPIVMQCSRSQTFRMITVRYVELWARVDGVRDYSHWLNYDAEK